MESSSKNNDNDKEKKKIYQQNNSSALHFMVFFLPRLALRDHNLRLPNATIYGVRENTGKNFHFFTTL